jgi:hypothetical protein
VFVVAARLAGIQGIDGAMTTDSVLRWVRAPALASVLFTLGLVGHVAAGGVTPATSVLIPLFGLTVIAVAPFAGTTLSPSRVVAFLIGGQGVLHAALQMLGASTITPASSHSMSSHLMTHPGATTSHGLEVPLLSGGHVIMLLAHLAAAVGVGTWLAGGERFVWRLLGLTVRPVVGAWRTVRNAARGVVGLAGGNAQGLWPPWELRSAIRNLVWTVVVSRRGPPSAVLPEPHAFATVTTV